MDQANIDLLKKTYASVDDIDLYVGILLERPTDPTALVSSVKQHFKQVYFLKSEIYKSFSFFIIYSYLIWSRLIPRFISLPWTVRDWIFLSDSVMIQLGPTGSTIIADQFSAFKKGDRFFYESTASSGGLTQGDYEYFRHRR